MPGNSTNYVNDVYDDYPALFVSYVVVTYVVMVVLAAYACTYRHSVCVSVMADFVMRHAVFAYRFFHKNQRTSAIDDWEVVDGENGNKSALIDADDDETTDHALYTVAHDDGYDSKSMIDFMVKTRELHIFLYSYMILFGHLPYVRRSNKFKYVVIAFAVFTLIQSGITDLLISIAYPEATRRVLWEYSLSVFEMSIFLVLFFLTRKIMSRTHNPLTITRRFIELDSICAKSAIRRASTLYKVMMSIGFTMALAMTVLAHYVMGKSLLLSIEMLAFSLVQYGATALVSILPVSLMHICMSGHTYEIMSLKKLVNGIRKTLSQSARGKAMAVSDQQMMDDAENIINTVHDIRIYMESTSNSLQPLLMSYFIIANVTAYMIVVGLGSLIFELQSLSAASSSTQHIALGYFILASYGTSLVYTLTYCVLYAWLFIRLARVTTDITSMQMCISDLAVECMYVLLLIVIML